MICFWDIVQVQATNSTKNLCFSGSTLYQSITMDCSTEDPSYHGDWYCSVIEVCESFISKYRTCIITKGCAKAEQCVDNSTSSGIYDGGVVQVNGNNAAGMTIKVSCCQAQSFPNDDTAAIDYSKVCNSSNRIILNSLYVLIATVLSALVLLSMH
eukprot:gene9634-12972_t